MPYKASMWDSLESVWRAAANNPECEAVVIPIPFYTIFNGGEKTVLNYEANLFPSYVPITDYRRYNLANHKIDAIFVHNVYDEYNTLTQVLPEYWTKNLKKYTKNLVYIPYYGGFFTSEHFTQLPGLSNVDAIIVANEKAKEQFEKNNPAKKILALGSPKVDAVVNMDKFPPIIPQEWMQKCKDKKVVFYNTSVGTLMTGGAEGLEQLQETLQYLSDKPDVEVIWRPHPLSEESIAFANKSLLATYEKIVADFKQNNMGIYDDTPDFHAAFALSDLYYGHGSSLANLYAFTGKPIMYQGVSANPFSQFVFFRNSLLEDKTMWISAWHFNGLFKCEIGKSEAEFLGSFPNEHLTSVALYGKPVLIGSKLIFYPIYANEIAIYDTETKEFSKVLLPKTEKEIPPTISKFAAPVVALENKIYMLGYEYPGIVCFNISTGNCERVLEETKFTGNACVEGSVIISAIRDTNKILEFNTETNESRIVEPPCKNKFWTHSAGGYIFLIPLNGEAIAPIVRWNRKDNSFKEFGNYPAGFDHKANNGYRFTTWGFACGYLWLFCVFQTNTTFIRLNIETGEMTNYTMQEKHNQYPYFVAEYGKAFLMSFNSNDLYIVLCEGEPRIVPLPQICIGNDFPLEKYTKELFSKPNINATGMGAFIRSELYPLSLLEYLLYNLDSAKTLSQKQIEACSAEFANGNGSAGESILKAVFVGKL
ncbi:hypothetical protein AGMMS49938_16650 [Fibrobacterales bacterium]|nr:hypothetical protein AGMMS49938_16650 [Fibrobacterales bacterium]